VNVRKLASAIRLLAPVILALADAVEDEVAGTAGEPPRPPRPSEPRRRVPRIPGNIAVSDLDRKAAERAAAGKGMLVGS